MSPSGLRTATAQFDGPRIITPSRTAWPPMFDIEVLSALGAPGLSPLEAALEALDTPAGVDELLLARVERVAVRADLDVQLGLVERVSNVFPQEHVTVESTYSGWMSVFMLQPE